MTATRKTKCPRCDAKHWNGDWNLETAKYYDASIYEILRIDEPSFNFESSTFVCPSCKQVMEGSELI